MPRIDGEKATYEAVDRFVEVAFRTQDSLFTPGRAIWSTPIRDDLYQRFVQNPDESSRSFLEKLKGQLRGAPSETIQLAAELLFAQLLTPWAISRKRKTELVETVLTWSPQPLPFPQELQAAFERGLANDMSFMQQRPFQLAFLLEVLRKWYQAESSRRDELLQDPWAFKSFLQDIPVKAAQPMREMLCHFVHPQYFEDISSRKHKRLIVDTFRDRIGNPTGDVDRDLYAIRRSLAAEHGERFTFYQTDVESRWRDDVSAIEDEAWERFSSWAQRIRETGQFDEREMNYKREIAANVAAARKALVSGDDDWVAQLKRAFGPPNNLTAWQTHDRFLRLCETDRKGMRQAILGLWSDGGESDEVRMRGFLDRLEPAAAKGAGIRATLMSFLLMGVDPEKYPIYRSRAFKQAYKLSGYRRLAPGADEVQQYLFALDFLDKMIAISGEGQWDQPIANRLTAQGVIWGLVHWESKPEDWTDEEWKSLEEFRSGAAIPAPESEPGVDDIDEPTDTSHLDGFAASLFLERVFLERVQRLLEEKRQVIFYGPPGTGKTFVAQKLAECLSGSPRRVRLVQFHPSYTYEDFFEGFRPNIDSGQASFELHEGPLKRLARDAAKQPDKPFILIIDEINRGNLAKVFGELYFLLEYRNHALDLQYSRQTFRLPDNLWFIGTMNTADRSIALIDAALRRRFYFVEFFPDRWPIKGLLRRWLQAKQPNMAWLADVVDRANTELNERHLAIGPSHFMKEGLTEEWVGMIWSHAVIPYLEEHFFGQPDRVDAFCLDDLRHRAVSVALNPAVDENVPHETDSPS